MRIQHNIMAMNAYRNYNTNTSALAKNLEKLSSGYKINRAGDDAAGLAISEKMRAQITGLNAAQKNVKDGISLVKTAEGAMQEIQDMLNRMDYLATQSANGTYDDPVDRYNLQKEVDQLKSEINRIADSANFNGINLLDGSQDGGSSAASMTDVDVTVEIDALKPTEATRKGIYAVDTKNFKFTAASGSSGTVSIKVAGKTIATATVSTGGKISASDLTLTTGELTIGGVKFEVSGSADSEIVLTMKEDPTEDFEEDMSVTITGVTQAPATQSDVDGALGNNGISDTVRVKQDAIYAADRVYASATFDLDDVFAAGIKDGDQIKIGNETYTFSVGKDSKFKSGKNIVDLTAFEVGSDKLTDAAARRLTAAAAGNKMFKVTTDNASGAIHLTEIDGAVDYNKNDLRGSETDTMDGNWTGLVKFGNAAASGGGTGLTLQIGDTSESYNQLTVSIGDMHTYGSMGIDGIDISTRDGASSAIDVIKNAINYVSGIRGDLGATQNRLEHTANNLSVMAENIQDAESTIRDTDVAEEMMKYTKNNILVQSAQAMLAQANAVPQGVLQLLG
ncbi:flagellin [uncultured Oscillibacter sp.]|uniref:flagellin N-terminal helical domain-containing protein n=1 Tax=uncultured Oscillibacter sp. TaxID=876091 RepID=UPI00261F4737|nr:flagellin [uncultured Oscillibacter sp.]